MGFGRTSTAHVSAPTSIGLSFTSHSAPEDVDARLAAAVLRVVLVPQGAPASVEEHGIAGADLDVLSLQGLLEVSHGDLVSGIEQRHPLSPAMSSRRPG